MHLGRVVLLVIGVVCNVALAAICPGGWQRCGESCYFLITHRMDWYQANITCFDKHANLAIPDSKQEHDFIWEQFLLGFEEMPEASVWIGCNDIKEEGKWEHCPLKNQTHSFENWKTGQPNNVNDADCGALGVRLGGQWDDQACSLARYAVCELPVTDSSVFSLQTGPDGRMSTKCLAHNVMKELPADGVVSCGKACRLERRCRSVNLLQQDGGQMTCQLNNSTQEAAQRNMREKENCYFFSL